MKKVLLIKSCTDPHLWYAKLIGHKVPFLGSWPEGWKSREQSGYVNIIRFEDAEIIDD